MTQPPTSDTSFAELVAAAAAGNTAAFASLVASHQDLAVGYAFALLGDHALAEDAAQEAFIEAFASLRSLEHPRAFSVWLRRIVFKHVDRIRRSPDHRNLVFAADDAIAEHPAAELPAGDDAPADHRLVRSALAALTSELRAVVILYYYEARGVERIAEFLEIPAGTVKSRLHTARTRMREAIATMIEHELARHRPSRNQEFVLRVALFAAARNGDLSAVEKILAVAPQLATAVGPHPLWGGEPTALHVAIENGRSDVVALLLRAGADPNHPSDRYDGWTPLLLAQRRPGILEQLRAHGARADIWEATALGETARVAELLDDQPSLVHARRPNDAPPLHFASTVEIARLLVDRGAGFDPVDKYGATAARSAAYSRHRRDVARFIMTLSGENDPWLAAALDDVESLRAHAAAGIDVANVWRDGLNPGSGYGERPIDTAAALGNENAVTFLLASGASPNAANDDAGPLHYAARAGADGIVQLLLANGADIRALDAKHRATPADWARFFGHGQLAATLDAVPRSRSETSVVNTPLIEL